jgi:hypothetical protein
LIPESQQKQQTQCLSQEEWEEARCKKQEEERLKKETEQKHQEESLKSFHEELRKKEAHQQLMDQLRKLQPPVSSTKRRCRKTGRFVLNVCSSKTIYFD